MTRRYSDNGPQWQRRRARVRNTMASLASAVFCALGVPNAPADEGAVKPHEVVVVHDLPYRDVASRHCTLDLAYPKGSGEERRPAIVVIHGGGWLEGDKSSFVTETNRVPGNIRDFAALGFVAVAINYRLSTEAPYPTGFWDCQCAVRWLRTHAREYHIDPLRIGAFGNSAGGHLALLLGLTEPTDGLDEKGGSLAGESSRVQSVVSDSGPLDLLADHDHSSIKAVIERFMGGAPDAARRADYERASPINHLTGKVPPLMLIYGERDEQIDVRTADRFVATLGRTGRADVTYFRLAAVRHCPYSLLRIPYLRPAVNEFFQRTLQLVHRPAKQTAR